MAKLRNPEKLTDKPIKSEGKKLSPIKTKGISGIKSTNKISSRSKISKTSKAAKQSLKEFNWIKGLKNKKSSVKQENSVRGIKTYCSPSLRFRKENNCEYAMFPWTKGQRSGYIKMHPLGEKERSETTTKMHFTILLGKLQLVIGNHAMDFECGSQITIPKGIHYSLKNPTSELTVLHFRSNNVD